MSPREQVRLTLEFAARWSPWWLLLLVPLSLTAVWLVYRERPGTVARAQMAGLLALRLGLVACLVVLAFRPTLGCRRIVTWPGRIVVLLDDSESMSVPDSGMSDTEALMLARQLGRPLEGASHCYSLAATVRKLAGDVEAFRSFSARADRQTDAFWTDVGRFRRSVDEKEAEFERTWRAAVTAAPDEKPDLDVSLKELRDFAEALPGLTDGSRDPGRAAWSAALERLDRLATRLIECQARVDRAALLRGDATRGEAAAAIRGTPRIELVRERLLSVWPALATAAGAQSVELVRLMAPADAGQPERVLRGLGCVAGRTNLVEGVRRILAQPNDFPLSAVIVVSDGRDLSGLPVEDAAREAARLGVPVHTAGAGSPREPVDLAVLDVRAPPLAVRGAPVTIRVRVKTSVSPDTEIRLELLQAGKPAASRTFRADGSPTQTEAVTFTPTEPGFFRCTVRVAPVSGEAVPARNNAADFALDVRPEKLRVLYVDWTPRWETRFALNVLGRLDAIELNPVIGVAQEGAKLRRDVRRGTFPESADVLALYDLIVIGDLPADTLTPTEWGWIRAAVVDKGRTLCLLSRSGGRPVPTAGGLAEALMPVVSEQVPAPGSQGVFRLTGIGALHPVTRPLRAAFPEGGESAQAPGARADTQVLVADAETAAPVVTVRFAGRGRTMLIATDDLWRMLNPRHLDAHTGMYVSLAAWAAAAPSGPEKPAAVALDERVLPAGVPLQVWAPNHPSGVIECLAGDGSLASQAEIAPLSPGTALGRAVFGALPSGDYTFRLKGDAGAPTAPVSVIDPYPELHWLARYDDFLGRITSLTAGQAADFTRIEGCVRATPPRERVERTDRTWRLWGAWGVLALTAAALACEWIWRKLVGLI